MKLVKRNGKEELDMVIREPEEHELVAVHNLLHLVPFIELPKLERFKHCVTAGTYPRILVAVYKGELIGVAVFASYYDLWGEGESFLYALAVDPEYRRKKVGVALVNAVREEAKKFDSPLIMLLVHKANTGALAFYESLGLIERDADSEFKKIAIPVKG
jgi:ribosomal protein S18 acetylase RimI-like enzyme